ncbi:MAG: carbohydrate ABC transporter substrate-binding protein, partial [Oscillospiraceae bacterium]
MKRLLALSLAVVMSCSFMVGCTKKPVAKETSSQTPGSQAAPKAQTLKVAALESAYGPDAWKEVVKAFEALNEGVTVELTIDKNIEDVIGPLMKAGDYPDVVHLGIGREDALTETLIKDEAIVNIEDVLGLTIPGESVKVSDKMVDGFTNTLVTNPYPDGKTYLAPMFYSPCGLFYNAGLLKEKGWEVPKTWDEMWVLGDKAKADGIALFTYPTAGYFDAFFFALLSATGGPDFFNKAMRYEEGSWDTAEAKTAFDIVAKLATYT